MAASQGGIQVRYFPFNEDVGPRLSQAADQLVKVPVCLRVCQLLAGHEPPGVLVANSHNPTEGRRAPACQLPMCFFVL